MKYKGTREFKEYLKCNERGRIGDVKVLLTDKGWLVLKQETDINKRLFICSKLDVVLDWMVDEGILDETRFRLTSYQKDILRQRIWEFIGTAILGGISMGIMFGIFIAWFLGF